MTRILTNLVEGLLALDGWRATYCVCYTYRLGSAASARAALDPLMPTLTPHIRLHAPTKSPDQKSANPV